MLRSSSSSSFVDDAIASGANHVRMCLFTRRMAANASPVFSFHMDIPFERFVMHLDKAAQHLAYSQKAYSTIVYRSISKESGAVLTMEEKTSSSASSRPDCSKSGGGGGGGARVNVDEVLGVQEVPGANVVFIMSRQSTPPALGLFSWCKDNVLDTRRVERLTLRVNSHANIVFESAASTCGGHCRGVNIRQIYITIRDIDRIAEDAELKRDVERTVDNTVQKDKDRSTCLVMSGRKKKQASPPVKKDAGGGGDGGESKVQPSISKFFTWAGPGYSTDV
eukprot:gene17344-23650_t